MKKRLLALLNAKIAQRDALNASMIEAETKEERAAIGETLSALAKEIADVEAMIAEIDEPADGGEGDDGARGINITGVATRSAAVPQTRNVDPFDTEEYRTAFMNFVCRGVAIPAELRADAVTTITDSTAVIPTTILNEMVKELKSYGGIYAKVRKLNVQGGVQIPILSLKPSASWIGDNADSDEQKLTANTFVSFNYYGVECKIAQTLLANVVSLAMFNEQFVPLATEAIAKALDIAIIKGTGTNQATGVTVDSRVPSANKLTVVPTDFTSWEGWKKNVFAKIPKAYRNGMFFMAQSTFDGYIDGMVDKNGQPIARVNYGIDGGEVYRFGGKIVETVEPDVIADYDTAKTGDVVAVYFNPTDYAVNSNMTLEVHKWIDRDTNKVKTQVILVCDGKLVDPNGVIIIKKGAAASA